MKRSQKSVTEHQACIFNTASNRLKCRKYVDTHQTVIIIACICSKKKVFLNRDHIHFLSPEKQLFLNYFLCKFPNEICYITKTNCNCFDFCCCCKESCGLAVACFRSRSCFSDLTKSELFLEALFYTKLGSPPGFKVAGIEHLEWSKKILNR